MLNISGSITVEVCGETLVLLPDKILWWPDQRMILLSDTHFGKSGTFRQAGVNIPDGHDSADFARLNRVLALTQALECVFLGDFFHSRRNRSWARVRAWTQSLPEGVYAKLIPGNHDILPASDYSESGIQLLDAVCERGPFTLIHDVHDVAGQHRGYRLGGHLHPGLRLSGVGRQGLTLPCFWFSAAFAVLPAFGDFTGLVPVHPSAGDRLFVTTGNDADSSVIEIPSAF